MNHRTIASTTYRATSRGFYTSYENPDNPRIWVIGPILVEVRRIAHTDANRLIRDTYEVHIDGHYQFGGFADHLDADYLPIPGQIFTPHSIYAKDAR